MNSCGFCGSNMIQLWAVHSPEAGRNIWVVQCGNGHVLVPIPSAVFTFAFPDAFENELWTLLEEESA